MAKGKINGKPAGKSAEGFGEKLRTETAAVRLRSERFGVKRSLTFEQKEKAAEPFHAKPQSLSASKRILDTRSPAYSGVTTILKRAAAYWYGVTVPYPEPGIRLIRKDRIETFVAQMEVFRGELLQALDELDKQFSALKLAAKEKLGTLFNAADYPESLAGSFDLSWEFPPLDAPAYLKQLNPALYEQEQKRISARFEEAVLAAEEAFASEFAGLVAHLTERLSGETDGKPKSFHKSTLDNLQEFFGKFAELNVRSNPELDALVASAQEALKGVDAKTIRDRDSLRKKIAESLGAVQQKIEELAIAKPRRAIELDDGG